MNTEIVNKSSPDLARTTLIVLRNWGVSSNDQIRLLGLSAEFRPRALNQFRNGTPLPDNSECMTRVSYILAIQNAVNSLFPHNSQACDYWVTTQLDYFANHSPLEIMLHEGIEGMRRVLNYLNGVEDWA